MELQSQHINQRKKLLPLLSRQEQLKQLKEMEYDVLVIGGGATGAGCALDAATRGKNCNYTCRICSYTCRNCIFAHEKKILQDSKRL